LSTLQCSLFVTESESDRLCTCPKCKGYLSRDFPIGKQFQCRKCGAVLETIPHNPYADEDDDLEDTSEDYEYGGKICLVPEFAIKIEVIDFKELRKQNPNRPKKKTGKWALGEGFSRMIWVRNGIEFIEIGHEVLQIADPRILMIQDESKEAKS